MDALYDHRSPDDIAAPEYYQDHIRALTGIVCDEITTVLPPERRDDATALTRSLLATSMDVAFHAQRDVALLGETTPLATVYEGVLEAIVQPSSTSN